MTDKKVKEMSVESIKGEIIDGLKNDLTILQYLDDSRCSNINSNTVSGSVSNIFNYYIETSGNYISVEAEEHEFSVCNPNDHKRYKVIIRMGTEREKNLDSFAELIKEIIVKLYPNRKNYSNVTVYRETISYNTKIYNLNRLITFEVETDSLV